MAWVEEMGGDVYYDFMTGGRTLDAYPGVAAWLEERVGIDFLSEVIAVRFKNSSKLYDVSPLVRLKGLRELSLLNTPLTDVTPLEKFKTLEKLYIHYTPVNEEDISNLQRALPNCRIDYDPSPW